MKPCIHCNVEKPLSEFYAHPQMKDGHLNTCKECHKEKMRGRSSLPHVKAYDKKRNMRPDRIAQRTAYQRSERGKEALKRGRAAYIERNPEKRKAHIAVGNAIRSGKLVKQPCEECGTEERVHAHHDDYTKPLEVRWLCAHHHARLHRSLSQTSNEEGAFNARPTHRPDNQ